MGRKTVSSDLETLGFLELKDLDSHGYTTAPGATPLMSDALMSVMAIPELGASSQRQVDGSSYRQVDFTAGSGASFRDTAAFGADDKGPSKPSVSLVSAPSIQQPAPAAAPVNLAPTAADHGFFIAEDTPITISAAQLIAGATDPNGDFLDPNLVQVLGLHSGPAGTQIVDNGNGTWTVTPPADFHSDMNVVEWPGDIIVDFRISDGALTADEVFRVVVTPVNDAPVALDDAYSLSMNFPDNGSVSASDVEGDSLTYTVQTAPQHGTLTLNADGTYTYTPHYGFVGLDTFEVRVADGNGGTDIATKEINVLAPSADLQIMDGGNVRPFFADIMPGNPTDVITVTVTLDDPDKGWMVNGANGGYGTYDAAAGTWTVTDQVSEIQTYLSWLMFTPNTGRVGLGGVEQTSLTLSTTNGYIASTTVNSTAGTATAGNDTWTLPYELHMAGNAFAGPIIGGLGTDTVSLGGPNNELFVFDGVEFVNATAGNDTLSVVNGNFGVVSYDFGAGDDWFRLGSATANVTGGLGSDTFVVGNGAQMTFLDFTVGEDTIDLTAFGATDWRLTAVDGTHTAIEVTTDGWATSTQAGSITDAAIAADLGAALAAMNTANSVTL